MVVTFGVKETHSWRVHSCSFAKLSICTLDISSRSSSSSTSASDSSVLMIKVKSFEKKELHVLNDDIRHQMLCIILCFNFLKYSSEHLFITIFIISSTRALVLKLRFMHQELRTHYFTRFIKNGYPFVKCMLYLYINVIIFLSPCTNSLHQSLNHLFILTFSHFLQK